MTSTHPQHVCTCKHCDEPIKPVLCAQCHHNIEDQCIECHYEVAHDMIPSADVITASRMSCPRPTKEEGDPGWDDAVRYIEDN